MGKKKRLGPCKCGYDTLLVKCDDEIIRRVCCNCRNPEKKCYCRIAD